MSGDTGDKYYGFGTTGWTPVTGKWTSDGYTKIGIYNAGNWYIDYNGDGQFFLQLVTGISPTERVDGHTSSGTGMETGRARSGSTRTDSGTLIMMAVGSLDANTKYYSFGGAGLDTAYW